jgi:hypothetical protein
VLRSVAACKEKYSRPNSWDITEVKKKMLEGLWTDGRPSLKIDESRDDSSVFNNVKIHFITCSFDSERVFCL